MNIERCSDKRRFVVIVGFSALQMLLACSSASTTASPGSGATNDGGSATPGASAENDGGSGGQSSPMVSAGCGTAAKGEALVNETFDAADFKDDGFWKIFPPYGTENVDQRPTLEADGSNKWMNVAHPVGDKGSRIGLERDADASLAADGYTLTLDADLQIVDGEAGGSAGSGETLFDAWLEDVDGQETHITLELDESGTPHTYVHESGDNTNWHEDLALDKLGGDVHCFRLEFSYDRAEVTAENPRGGVFTLTTSVDGKVTRTMDRTIRAHTAPKLFQFFAGLDPRGSRPATHARMDNVVLRHAKH